MNLRVIPLAKAPSGNEQAHQLEQFQTFRRQEDVRLVRQTAKQSFSAVLLQELTPRYEPGHGGFPPCMHFVWLGVLIKLNWRQFLWAAPGEEDYLEGRQADGTPVQFTPCSQISNDQRLLQLIDSYCQQRPWWRKLWDRSKRTPK